MPSEDILASISPAADLTITYGPDPNQFVHIRLPRGKGPHPVVFFVHGGYWRAKYNLEYAGHLCHALKAAGIATWNVEYRRVGHSGGGWPGTFEDIRSAFKILTTSQDKKTEASLDLSRLCVAGHSAGAQLALCLGAHEPGITRLLSLAGVVDLQRAWDLHLSNDAVSEFLGGPPGQTPEHYGKASPAELPIRATQKLIHGTLDDSVPYDLSKSYSERKKQAGETVELITLPEVGHFELVDPKSSVWNRIQEEFIHF